MQICVCLKTIQQVYARSGRDPQSHFVAAWDTLERVNPYDEAAMAIAVQLKSAVPGAQITVLTIGPILARADLARCLAMGADHFYQIQPAGQSGTPDQPAPMVKAEWLAEAINHLDATVVLCGKESLDRRNGICPAFVAGRLGRPFVAGISDLRLHAGRAEVSQSAGRGLRRVIACELPAVFSVESGPLPADLPTVTQRQAWHRRPAGQIIVLGSRSPAPMRPLQVSGPRPRTRRVAVPAGDQPAFERVSRLLAARQAHKQTQLEEGSPEELAARLMDFLNDHGHLPGSGPDSDASR